MIETSDKALPETGAEERASNLLAGVCEALAG